MVYLNVHQIACAYHAAPILQGVTFSVEPGEFWGLIGPNGAGKSTLLKTLSRILKPHAGVVCLGERDLQALSPGEVARSLGVIGQEERLDFAFKVWDVVLMGRYPHLRRFQREGPADLAKVEQALVLTHTQHLAQRLITEISGGERQRVLFARALVQDPQILILDEPIAHLDIQHQVEILNLIRHLQVTQKLTVIMALHDLNLASQYCSQLALLHQGRVYALGKPDQVLTVETIQEVYQSAVFIYKHPDNQRPQILLRPQQNGADQKAATEGRLASKAPETQRQEKRLHIVGGGGAARPLLSALVNQGYTLCLGVINQLDSDWELAQDLGVDVLEAPPFTGIGQADLAENQVEMEKAGGIILTDIPFSYGNLANLQAVLGQAQKGQRVWVVNGSIVGRDYTQGEATQLFNQLLSFAQSSSPVQVVHTWPELMEQL